MLTIDQINALLISINITNSVLKELLNRYKKDDPNYNALCELSTNLQLAKSKIKKGEI